MRQDLPLYKIRVPLEVWRWLVSKGCAEVVEMLTEAYEQSKIKSDGSDTLDDVQISDLTSGDDYWKNVD